ncbi:uncharacterized protein HMPREF1120_03983 [Exophiala dermatitidis NIH/UT8656]|uniref:Uncharacterized protein n=1 Tax=Exophiala dermatitidis (strain ATCC 34100 / CBS 525.76 / NIH/UT8656) TaxID=858893 RepID=H6BVD8_EXODN|nr:uncharacterized protein HMPREF1120_03983 [Exophiala dermatitidis NIH/UT8656]EHY55868.1 hypothetical protein HMPREF1120_03983 [Exophiala dermatitidis NIH/UT8656]
MRVFHSLSSMAEGSVMPTPAERPLLRTVRSVVGGCPDRNCPGRQHMKQGNSLRTLATAGFETSISGQGHRIVCPLPKIDVNLEQTFEDGLNGHDADLNHSPTARRSDRMSNRYIRTTYEFLFGSVPGCVPQDPISGSWIFGFL